jgi:hypothetical protein
LAGWSLLATALAALLFLVASIYRFWIKRYLR